MSDDSLTPPFPPDPDEPDDDGLLPEPPHPINWNLLTADQDFVQWVLDDVADRQQAEDEFYAGGPS